MKRLWLPASLLLVSPANAQALKMETCATPENVKTLISKTLDHAETACGVPTHIERHTSARGESSKLTYYDQQANLSITIFVDEGGHVTDVETTF